MPTPADYSDGKPGLFARWWKNWKARDAAVSELRCCDRAEETRIAQDVGVSVSELRTLAGRWPDSAGLLERRMSAVGLNARAALTVGAGGVARPSARVRAVCRRGALCARSRSGRAGSRMARLLSQRRDARRVAGRGARSSADAEAKVALMRLYVAVLLIAAPRRARHAPNRSPRGPTRLELRARELRSLPCDRPGEPEPARDRAAVPRAAQALPGREPAGSVRRGYPDRTSEHAGIPARTGSDRRRDRFPQDAGAIARREAARLISINIWRDGFAQVVRRIGTTGRTDERGKSWRLQNPNQ